MTTKARGNPLYLILLLLEYISSMQQWDARYRRADGNEMLSAGLSTTIYWPTAGGRQQQQPSAGADDEARRQQQQPSPG